MNVKAGRAGGLGKGHRIYQKRGRKREREREREKHETLNKQNSVALVRERTIPTEQLALVCEVCANFR
jgi:hypothetical protein